MVTDINNINAPQPGRSNGNGAVDVDRAKASPEQRNNDTGTASSAAAGDTVELSSQAQDLGRIQQALQDLPEVDAERVAAVAEQVASGNYVVDAEQIALQILVNERDFDA